MQWDMKYGRLVSKIGSEHGIHRILEGHEVLYGGIESTLNFYPYFNVTYLLSSSGNPEVDFPNPPYSEAGFNGRFKTRVKSDFGNFTVRFPFPEEDQNPGSENDKRVSNQIELFPDNVIYGTPGNGSQIMLGTEISFGVKTRLMQGPPWNQDIWLLPDMSFIFKTLISYKAYPGDLDHRGTSCTDISVSPAAGWSDKRWGPVLVADAQTPADGLQCYIDPGSGLEDVEERSRSHARKAMVPPLTTKDDPKRQEKSFVVRGKKRPHGFNLPGAKRLQPMDIGMAALGYLLRDQRRQMECSGSSGCMTCAGDDGEPCCGCTCMDCVWGLSNIGECQGCNERVGKWPHVSGPDAPDDDDGGESAARLDLKNSTASPSSNSSAPDHHDNEEGERPGLDIPGRLKPGVATMGKKRVSICNGREKFWGLGDYRYPSFPADPGNPWDGIQNGRWDSISRYWGNTSADCADWSVGNMQPHDNRTIGPLRTVRADYQTEHVFEGQLIGDFFTWWLDQGKIKNQRPEPVGATQKVDCFWTGKWITNKPDGTWTLSGKPVSFIHLLLAELGSIAHMDRLTIYLSRPNGMKGAMFEGNNATSTSSYGIMSHDEQLQSVKEMGMTFTYFDQQDVWDRFCGTYEAIYNVLGDFDDYYDANRGTYPKVSLKDEWKAYIRVVLDSLVLRSIGMFDYMDDHKNAFGPNDAVYKAKWKTNVDSNRSLINITRTCNNMDKSAI